MTLELICKKAYEPVLINNVVLDPNIFKQNRKMKLIRLTK